MKKLCLIVWMILTVFLTFSIVGLLLFVPDKYENDPNIPSTWMKIGIELVEDIIRSKQ